MDYQYSFCTTSGDGQSRRQLETVLVANGSTEMSAQAGYVARRGGCSYGSIPDARDKLITRVRSDRRVGPRPAEKARAGAASLLHAWV
jgi:hypothetical protein